MITVTLHSPDADLDSVWTDLVARASANAFMHPAALKAASETRFAKIHVLVAYDQSAEPCRPVGLWALRERRVLPILPTILEGIPYEYAFLSSPVLDPAFADETMAAFFAAIEQNRQLPRVICLKDLYADAQSFGAMQTALTARRGRTVHFAKCSRAAVSRDDGVKRSGSTRKKLRQDWNRLGALGAASIVNSRNPDQARDAFEIFLKLEANSWKGETGTALLCDDHDARFVRQMFSRLAEHVSASVALLHVGDRTVAAQVLMYCGATAYTWKTAFDGEFARFSPGALLIDKITEELFAGAEIDHIDSCSVEGGFMASLWTGRRRTVDMVIAITPEWSMAFAVEAARQLGWEYLRDLRARLRGGAWLRPAKKAPVAVPNEATGR